ncbi:ATP synthase delta/epsilon chain alpha-helix domain-containing protein [Clostridium tarantellae]|uniref:ATP synthase epsilon chain n=1 Tax=Clostridium tarantellae TaxID=39493 RepID=A0A6I1MK41_9CLOT|nr:ATP synthase delta/epsilon chain alpha-helix domain-containing protein [Clostridium tarantellae]MPQ42542.1 F0F1 ATP synthase subunit epsilon [Clostridium tarantellae]
MKNFKLIIKTPEKEFYNGDIIRFSCQNKLGKFQILANYEPFITSTIPSISVIHDSQGKEFKLATFNGIMKVRDNEAIFCVDVAEWPEDIDLERAQKAKERAESRLKDRKNIDVERAKLALIRAMTRLDLK